MGGSWMPSHHTYVSPVQVTLHATLQNGIFSAHPPSTRANVRGRHQHGRPHMHMAAPRTPPSPRIPLPPSNMCRCAPPPPPPLGALEWALPGALTHDSTPPLALPGGRIHGRPRDGGEHLAALEEQLPQLVHSALSWRPLDALSPRSATARHSSPFLPLAAERALWGALHALGTTW